MEDQIILKRHNPGYLHIQFSRGLLTSAQYHDSVIFKYTQYSYLYHGLALVRRSEYDFIIYRYKISLGYTSVQMKSSFEHQHNTNPYPYALGGRTLVPIRGELMSAFFQLLPSSIAC